MKKLLGLFSILLFSVVILGCNNTPPPPDCPPEVPCDSCCVECPECPIPPGCPECPECPEWECPEGWTCTPPEQGPSCGDLRGDKCSQDGVCPEGYEPLQVTWDCNPCCVEKVEPPPPIDADPADYISKALVPSIINNVENDSRSDIYLGTWVSMRHPQNAARYCGDKVEPELGITQDYLYSLSGRGETYMNRWERHWKVNFTKTNGRCGQDASFCNKTDVKRDNWNAWKKLVTKHNDEIRIMNATADNHFCRDIRAYDNIQGWCCRCYGRGGGECSQFTPVN